MLDTPFTQKLTLHARHSLREARDIARYTRSELVEPEHLLLAIFMEHGSLGSVLLENMGFEKETLAKLCLKKKSRGKAFPLSQLIPLSESLKQILQRAYFLASQFQYPYVGTEHLIYSLMESDAATLDDIILSLNIDEKKIESTLSAHMSFEHFPQLAKMFDLPENILGTAPGKNGATPFLDQYASDMAEDERASADILVGRVAELERLMHVLSRRQKNNPLLIGEPGVGKTALVAALARKLSEGDVPPHLAGKRVLSLDLALVVAGTNFRGEFETRIKEILRESAAHPEIILFIDEIHTLIGAGNTSGGLDAANILKPALSRGDIQCIGATTFSEYKRHLEKDSALERRFQTVILSEPTPEEAKTILAKAKESYEAFHRLKLPQKAVDLAVDLSVRYIPDRFLPDKAFDVIDEAAALAKHALASDPATQALALLESGRHEARRKKEELLREEKYDEALKWHNEEKALGKKIAAAAAGRKPAEKGIAPLAVSSEHVYAALSRMTGLPLEKLSPLDPKARLERLRAALSEKLVGQSRAAQAVEHSLARSLSHVSDPRRPLGSFLFLGPTGVGKTLLGKILAEEFFGDEKALIRLDMSEFMERHSVAQILGAPAGYVGYGEGGKLTEAVRRRPYSVILFDEIEKAHPDIFNILLQILDEGFLTDAEGRRVSFRNTLILLTSNIGTAAFAQNARIGFARHAKKGQPSPEFEQVKQQVLEELKRELRPELLARLDQVIVFNALDPDALLQIARLELAAVASRLKKRGVRLLAPLAVSRFLAKESASPEQGARLVRKNIQEHIERAVADRLLVSPDQKILRLSLKDNRIVCL